MATRTSLATITGTMLTPGVSKNNRLYTQPAIGRAVKRMQERIKDPDGLPIVMRTHHDAGDDSRQIVGRITDVRQEADGSATYKAKLFNTEAGRDLAPLITPDPEDGKAALRTTSIHGYWIGPTERYKQATGAIETGDDLEINAIDFTYTPGVAGARISSVTFESTEVKWPTPGANVHDGHNIFESMQASIVLDEIHEERVEQVVAEENFEDIPLDPNAVDISSLDECYISVCVGDSSGEIVNISAPNLSPDIVKKAIKLAGKRAAAMIANGQADEPDGDEGPDLITDVDDIDFKVAARSPDAEPVNVDATNNGGYSSPRETTEADEPTIKETAMADDNATAASAAPAVEAIDYTKLATVLAETMMGLDKAKADKKAAKKAAKAKESSEKTKGAVAESTKAASEGVKEAITPEQLETKLAEERAKTIAELRESILRDGGIPQRKGFRHVGESMDENPTGEDLWAKRQDLWSAAYPNVFPAIGQNA